MKIRCKQCVLPESNPYIELDPNGVCGFCKAHEEIVYIGEDALLELLSPYRRRVDKYNCVVPVSGGRDSMYTLLRVVKDFKLKALAVNYENPFTDPQATANMETAVKLLGVDLVKFKFKNKIHERTFRNNTIAWFKKPSPGAAPMICIACKSMWRGILKIAKSYNIQCIVSGASPYELISFKNVLLGLSPVEKNDVLFTKAIIGIMKENLKNLSYLRPGNIPTMVKGYFFADPNTIGSRIWGRNLLRIELFFFTEWNEEEILSRIRSEIGWDHPQKLSSTWRFDCKVSHLKDYMYLKTLGMTEKDDLYAKMVRQGLITRDEGLQRLEVENRLYLDEIHFLFKKVGISDTSVLKEVNGAVWA